MSCRVLQSTDSHQKFPNNARSIGLSVDLGTLQSPSKTMGRAFSLLSLFRLLKLKTGTNRKRKFYLRSDGEFTPERMGIYDAPRNPAAFLVRKINGYASDRYSSNYRQTCFAASVPLNVKSEPIKVKNFFRALKVVLLKSLFLKAPEGSSACLSRGWGVRE